MKKLTLTIVGIIGVAVILIGVVVIRNRNQNDIYVPIQDQDEVLIETSINESSDTSTSIDETIDSIDKLISDLKFDSDFEEVEDF